MDIIFSRGMEKNCQDRKSAVREWGPEQGRQIMRRIEELRDIQNLAQLWCFPAYRPHELTGDREGQISIDVKDPYRLIIIPANDPIPRKSDGGLDRESITKICIWEVVNTHDGKIKR